MSMITMISLSVTVGMMLLSVLFKIAGKLRLTIPFIYLILTATVLNKWAAAHETVAFFILFAFVGITILSWIKSLHSKWKEKQYFKAINEDIRWQTERARQMGIPFDSVHFDSYGNMRYNTTNELVI